ncbi:hypothetical protein [Lacisediminihabitans sp.]|uniref:hypothetical protein n=1 Tax=Lacisediminihabitans sp. TaxID=2787631 RepID=UPI002F95ACED
MIGAALASRGNPVLSHQSAAIMWRLPIIGQWPNMVHVLAARTTGTRIENGFMRHASDRSNREYVELEGVRVTTLEDTLLDMAASVAIASAVASIDFALRKQLTSRGALQGILDERGGIRYRRRIARAVDFATPLSGSPGESLSRVNIHELGFPAPVLQARFEDYRGHIGDTDFWWPGFGLIGEFDGLVKYTRNEYTNGRSVDEVMIEEKVREDRLRARGPSVSRWLWGTAMRPRELFRQLSAAGLKLERR